MFLTPLKTTLITIITIMISMSGIVHSKQEKITINKEKTAPLKDAGVINKERIIYWLHKRGELEKDVTKKEELDAFNNYVKTNKSKLNKYVFEIDGKPIVNATNKKHKHSKKSLQKSSTSSIQSSAIHKVNVLTLLIDFPDLPHDNNRLSSNDTSMFYEKYDAEHYQNLLFSPNTFAGPNGEALMSAHQYYLDESGNTFEFNGKVFGWLTADNNASFYGENDENGSDKDATTLIKEALNKAVLNYDITLSDFDLVDPADLDGDGVIAEPDGYIDYLMVFHSSVGADAGGGVLGEDAIWAHRWNISDYEIPNTDYAGTKKYRAHGYTVQGIDSAIGVVAHEFGHLVANLPDEYDTNDSVPNSPVAFWSLMAGGSWGGDTISGSTPTGFSPLAKVKLQEAFGGNWITPTTINLAELKESTKVVDLVAATTHEAAINLIDITLPAGNRYAIKPFAGQGQFHSSMGNNLSNRLSFKVTIPDTTKNVLAMKAYWDIEDEWDYAQVLVNGEAIAGNHTKFDNTTADTFQWIGLLSNYLSGKSASIAHGWLDLEFDVSEYQGQEITISVVYTTDDNTGGQGLFIDNITLISDNIALNIDNAELESPTVLNGFTQINTFVNEDLSTQNYYIQLRNYSGVDIGLDTAQYDHGVLMWLADSQFYDNNVSLHPGQGFISVIDADQNLIQDEEYGIWWSTNQVRDAVFSLFDQRVKSADNSLTPIKMFDDQTSYISVLQPESGVKVPSYGITMELLEQAEDSSTAKIQLSAAEIALSASFTTENIVKNKVEFVDQSEGDAKWLHYRWNFGDDSPTSFENSPTHTFSQNGSYKVKLEITDESGNSASFEKLISTQDASFSSTINFLEVAFTNTTQWGNESLTYLWNFGDGMQSDEQSPTHAYTEVGSYTVVLTATTTDGIILSFEQEIVIKEIDLLQSDFITKINHMKVHAINKTVNGAGKLTYSWDFGDKSGKKAGTSPTHVYKNEGEFTITLSVTDSIGRVSESSQSVTVVSAINTDAGSFYWLVYLISIVLVRKSLYRVTNMFTH